jgi:hypothetical protein
MKLHAGMFNHITQSPELLDKIVAEAQGRFEGWVEKQVLVYGHIKEDDFFFRSLYAPGDTYTARIIDFKQIINKQCDHQPKIKATDMGEQYYCMKCGKKMFMTWKVES